MKESTKKKKAQVKREMPKSVDFAYRSIKEDILRGTLNEGDVLVEVELSERIGVSRTPVREALNRLSHEGLVTIERYSKSFVSFFSEDDIKVTFEIRAFLEGFAARRAAERITDEQLSRLEELDVAMHQVLKLPREEAERVFFELNEEFHGIILSAANNKRITNLTTNMLALPFRRGAGELPQMIEFLTRACVFHREIVEALKARDQSRSEQLMRSHVLSLLNKHIKPSNENSSHNLMS